jgi:hypothetical protein
MGVGGNSAKQSSDQSATNTGFGSAMNLGQENQFQNLWAQAGAVNDVGGQQQLGYNAYNQAQGLGQAGIGQLGAAGQYNQASMNAYGGPQMRGAFNTLNQMQNPGTDPMMGVYGRQIGQQFNEQIMPGLRGDAMVGGTLGGSRAGIAQGLAGARMGQQLQDFGAQLYGQNQDRRLNAANMAGNLSMQQGQGYGQGAAMAGQLGQQYGSFADQAQQLGQFGMGIPWHAQQQLAGLLGPAIMRDRGGYSTGTSSGSGSGGGGWNMSLGALF